MDVSGQFHCGSNQWIGNTFSTSGGDIHFDTNVAAQQEYDGERRIQCHQTFKVGPYEEQKNLNPNRADGTCQWVLSHTQYKQWCATQKDNVLWISADPGCGKSVLARSLIDHELGSIPNHNVLYFFFKDNDEQDNLATALCALLHQLFSQQPQLTQNAMPAWSKAGDQLRKDVSELWRILLAAAKDTEAYDTTCVLDAMDECRPSDRRSLIEMLSRFYVQTSSLRKSGKRRLRFLLTSRPYDDIQAEFQKAIDDLPTIRLRGEDENDQIHQEIDLVIRMRVNELAKELSLDVQTKDQLTYKLLHMEHRTYLWLHLAIDDIVETYRQSLRPREAMIESLPATVDAAYESILARVSEKQRNNVKKILQIVIGARRALNIEEMTIALGISTTTGTKSLDQMKLDSTWLEQRIRQWCGLFIFINHTRIYLIHQTAKEFLINNDSLTIPPSRWKKCLNLCEAEKEMTRICTTFICLEEVRPVAYKIRSHLRKVYPLRVTFDGNNYVETFLSYSIEHWPHHFREAQFPMDDGLLTHIYDFYDTNSRLYDIWFPIFWRMTGRYSNQPQMDTLRLVAFLGHETVLQAMLQLHNTDYNIHAIDDFGRTALTWACEYNRSKVVQILLEKGADVNAQGRAYGMALYVASREGHVQVVQMLLKKGADVNAQRGVGSTALYVASREGHVQVVQILLENGADVNDQGGWYGTALCVALERGRARVVQMLLDMGADFNPQEGQHITALHTAYNGGHHELVQTLLDTIYNRGHKRPVQALLT